MFECIFHIAYAMCKWTECFTCVALTFYALVDRNETTDTYCIDVYVVRISMLTLNEWWLHTSLFLKKIANLKEAENIGIGNWM